MSTVEIDPNATIIGAYAFESLGLSGDITIPEHIEKIENSAFSNNDIESVTILNENVEFGINVFQFNYEHNKNEDLIIKGHNISTARDYAAANNYTFIAIEDDYEWVDNGDGTVSITDYKGSDTDIAIPSRLDGKDVTVIGEEAFKQKNLELVQIPDGVKEIGRQAFAENKLTSVTIPEKVTKIESGAFLRNELSTLNLHHGVEEIEYQTFAANELASIYIPASVHTIRYNTFITNPVETIEVHPDNQDYKDINQTGLYTKDGQRVVLGTRAMEIDSNAEIIGRYAFLGLGLSGDITIPEHITTIGLGAFRNNDIESVTILNENVQFLDDAFENNQSNSQDLTIRGYDPSTTKDYASDHDYTFKAFGTEDGFEWMEHAEGLVTIIGYTGGETELEIPAELGNRSVAIIGEEAFQQKGLTSIHIPASAHTIEARAFAENPLESMEVHPDNPSYKDIDQKGLYTIDGTTIVQGMSTMEIDPDATIIGTYAFESLGLSGDITIPDYIEKIEGYAFQSNDIESVTILNENVEFGINVFQWNQSNPEDLIIKGHNISTARDYAAANNHTFIAIFGTDNGFEWKAHDDDSVSIIGYTGGETELEIPAELGNRSVTIIGEEVFQQKGFTSIYIPASIKEIQSNTFIANPLETIEVHPDNQHYKDIDHKALYTIDGQTLVLGTKAVEFDPDAIAIGRNAFYGLGLSGDMTVPEHIETIGHSAFNDNDISSVTILNESVQFLDDAFQYNQDNNEDLTVRGYDPSTAKDFANQYGYTFVAIVEDEDSNGSSSGGIVPPPYIPPAPGPSGDSDEEGSDPTESDESDQTKEDASEQPDPDEGEAPQQPALPTVTFDDLEQHWAKFEIEHLASLGIIHGMSEHEFAPHLTITRAQFTALLVRSLNIEPSSGTGSMFSDVNPGAWYEEEVYRAANAGLVSGYPDDTFRPETNISREELAALMYRAVVYVGQDTNGLDPNQILGLYQDLNEVSDWALQSVAYSVEHGIIRGTAETQLAPKKEATRAEAAVMLYRLLDKMDIL